MARLLFIVILPLVLTISWSARLINDCNSPALDETAAIITLEKYYHASLDYHDSYRLYDAYALVYGGRRPGTSVLGLSQLAVKSLGSVHFKDAHTKVDLVAISLLKTFPRLEILGVADPTFSDATLSPALSMQTLKYLDLGGTQLTDAGLLRMAKLPNLVGVDVFQSQVTDQGVRRFRERRPDVIVHNWYH